MTRSNGAVVYRGASLYDGAPLAVIVTGLSRPSANPKTGPMSQAWILWADVDPMRAARLGLDRAGCGDCALRPFLGGGCYVQLRHAPAGIYRALQRGAYPERAPADVAVQLARGCSALRIGAYGDPAAVPAFVWAQLTSGVHRVTGYTHGHAWSVAHGAAALPFAMASCESADDASMLASRGIRYFRVGAVGELPGPGEVRCPASSEARAESGRDTTCLDCGLCDGSRRSDIRPLPSVFINAHGRRRHDFR